ncbi:MAG: hypothetical protein FD131_2256 [Rhodocyclaceae bacterium]|nr:MAG: hypothetical protein FD131_2256 [Rhodocyclaceae bacterium]
MDHVEVLSLLDERFGKHNGGHEYELLYGLGGAA